MTVLGPSTIIIEDKEHQPGQAWPRPYHDTTWYRDSRTIARWGAEATAMHDGHLSMPFADTKPSLHLRSAYLQHPSVFNGSSIWLACRIECASIALTLNWPVYGALCYAVDYPKHAIAFHISISRSVIDYLFLLFSTLASNW
jgi:hypothetical protein